MAYCTAVKETLVRLDRKATKAALASPAARLSAATVEIHQRHIVAGIGERDEQQVGRRGQRRAEHQDTHDAEAGRQQPAKETAERC